MNLNVNEWKEFFINRTKNHCGLFEIQPCKCGNAGNLDDGNDLYYIGAKKNDNGIMKKVKADKNLISKGNGIIFICDGEGSVGYTNYMPMDFIGSRNSSNRSSFRKALNNSLPNAVFTFNGRYSLLSASRNTR